MASQISMSHQTEAAVNPILIPSKSQDDIKGLKNDDFNHNKYVSSERKAECYKRMLITSTLMWVILAAWTQYTLRQPETTRARQLQSSNEAEEVTKISYGVYPMLRELSCGHENLEVPRLLRQEGRGRIVVDVGVAFDAHETATAVQNGFHVIGFEPNPGNIQALRVKFKSDPQISIVDLVPTGDPAMPWKLPDFVVHPSVDAKSGRGVGYIIAAGLGEKSGITRMAEGRRKKGGNRVQKSYASKIGSISDMSSVELQAGDVPVVKLDDILPSWAAHVTMMKLDTQGWELKVLQGAKKLLTERRVTYVQYEFSPWLMNRSSTGDPNELARLLPSLGAMCFDMLEKNSHNARPRPSAPLEQYVQRLTSGRGSKYLAAKTTSDQLDRQLGDSFGPWEDITCYFPPRM